MSVIIVYLYNSQYAETNIKKKYPRSMQGFCICCELCEAAWVLQLLGLSALGKVGSWTLI